MSDMSPPAGNSGGETTTPIAAALAELPARIRVHALAKLLGRSSREVLAAVTELGADGRSVQSSIDRELALRVAETLGVTTPADQDVEPDETPEPSRQAPSSPQAPGFRQSAAGSPGFAAPGRTAPATPTMSGGTESPARVTPPTPVFASASPLFLPPEPTVATPPRPSRVTAPKEEPEPVEDEVEDTEEETFVEDVDEGRPRRRPRRAPARRCPRPRAPPWP